VRTRGRPALLMLLPLLLVSTAARGDDAAVRKALAKQYAKADQALKRKDTKGVFDTMTADYKMVAPNGMSAPRKQLEMMLPMQLSMLKTVKSVTTTIDKLTIKGKSAVATATQKLVATAADPRDPKGGVHTIEQTQTMRDTWVQASGAWKRKQSDTLSNKLLVDGKPPQGMGAPRPPR
jgi:hypothetical protein